MKTINIQCPSCGKQGEKKTQSRIILSKDKQARDKILDGSYFEYECAGCNGRFFTNSPFLYNDDENGFMVYFVPGFKERSQKVPTVLKTLKGFDTDGSILRVAASFSDFIEKIRIFEAELDDKVIEAVKLMYISMYEQDNGKKVHTMVFESTDDAGLHFGVYLEDTDFEVVLPKNVIGLAIVDFSVMFDDDPQGEFVVIDAEWLSEVLANKK